MPTSPRQVQLWFTEEIEPSVSGVVVYDAMRQRVDRNDSHVAPGNPRSLIVDLKPDLPSGSYVIAWETQSRVDGHVTRGSVPFGVGIDATSSATSSVAESEAVSGTPPEMVLRWISLLTALGLVGATIFWRIQRAALADLGPGSPGASIAPVQRVVVWVTLGGFAAGRLGLSVLQTATARNLEITAAIGPPLVQMVATTRYGQLLALQLALGLLLAILLVSGAPARARSWITECALAAVLLAALALGSHSAAVGSLTPFGVANDWLHLVAAAIWTGGLIQLVVLTFWLLRHSGTAGTIAVARLVARFSAIAGLSVLVLGATGLVQAYLHVGTPGALLDSGYGQALLVKIVLLLPVAALAGIHHFLIRPVLLRAIASGSIGRTARATIQATALAFRWTATMEALLLVGVVAATGALTSLSPPRQPSSGAAGPLSLSATADHLAITLEISPASPGLNRFVVIVREPATQGPPQVGPVVIRLADLRGELAEAEVPLTQAGSGRFTGQSRDLAVEGRWKAEVRVRQPGHDDAIASFLFEITTTGGRTIEPPGPSFGLGLYAGIALALAAILVLRRAWVIRALRLRQALAIAVAGLLLGGLGVALAAGDVQRAEADAAVRSAALSHPPTLDSIARGQRIYLQNCAVCHGVDARGTGPMATQLNPPPSNLIIHVPQHTDADLEYWIANGFPGAAMPAFKDKLTEPERWDVLNYLKAQAKAADTVSP